jgi:hypothetical protein
LGRNQASHPLEFGSARNFGRGVTAIPRCVVLSFHERSRRGELEGMANAKGQMTAMIVANVNSRIGRVY